eukprot:CAMPEP_0182437662 /NCGR_PEP_ID=MMETSP1167-20130531/85196_1 /TAXON_ID=2988 /ORGANISM="Mallomonas Sp, Strain CCMP3275" /LENGTH=462 /DNA_ID=CAMNT_0024630655 /DNA_START=537 /DNA_END=1925 /DNA_ORIENTATION=-
MSSSDTTDVAFHSVAYLARYDAGYIYISHPSSQLQSQPPSGSCPSSCSSTLASPSQSWRLISPSLGHVSARTRLTWNSSLQSPTIFGTVEDRSSTGSSLFYHSISSMDTSNESYEVICHPFHSKQDGFIWNIGSLENEMITLLCCDKSFLLYDMGTRRILQRLVSDSPVVACAPQKYSGVSSSRNQSANTTNVIAGLRNGKINSHDIRTSRTVMTIGSLPMCCDHIHSLNDGLQVIAQDITCCIRVFDIRQARRALLHIRPSEPAAALRHRRFWVNEEHGYVVSSIDGSIRGNGSISDTQGGPVCSRDSANKPARINEGYDKLRTLEEEDMQPDIGAQVGMWSIRQQCTLLKTWSPSRELARETVTLAERQTVNNRQTHGRIEGGTPATRLHEQWVKLCGNYHGDDARSNERGAHNVTTADNEAQNYFDYNHKHSISCSGLWGMLLGSSPYTTDRVLLHGVM